ncbi:MAG: carboxypeptidase regulatory-like domain-containing protein [candidate division WOR-3 bacterium]
MRRLMVVLIAAGLVTGAVAWPGWTGGKGLFRIQDARSEGNWNGSLMIQGISATWTYDRIAEPWRIGMSEGTKLFADDVTAVVSLSPIKWFELFCWSGATIEYTTVPEDSVFWGYHNLVPGAKLSIPVIPVAKLGVLAGYSMYPNFDDFRGGWRWGKFALPFVNGITWTGLATFDFSEKLPLLHVNYGQATDEDEVGTQTKYTTFGTALEYQVSKLDIFAEFVSVQTSGSLFDNTGRMYLTPGIKIGYLRPLLLQAGVSVGLTDSVAPLEFTAGLGVSGRLFKPCKPRWGAVAGRVYDAKTGQALAATVSFPTLTKPSPVTADRTSGRFTAKGVQPGDVVVRVTATGYVPAEKSVTVTAGRTAHVEFALEREVTTGTIVGCVTDPSTGNPLSATVELTGTSIPPARTDANGNYQFENLAAGDYTLSASADGYLTATARATVRPKQETRADFELVKAGIKITLKVYFDFDKATLKPESHSALEAAAKIMKENPQIRVEIQGHTDNIGTAEYNDRLSLRRAQAVVDYLVGLGISRNRLSARGFGFRNPAASNDTEEGRAQNRRVEFVVLD